jgi:hypothetical protein
MTANKAYGPAVSGYLIPDGRAWETVVTQAGKPLLDKELNLSQDLDGGAAQEALRLAMPSGWISSDFLTTSDPVSAIFTPVVVANALKTPNGLKAHVNGWLLNISNSYANGFNQLDLTAGPAGAGAKRTDLVILEVFRRLISASPSTVGKSATAHIWQQGNVATSPADDLTLNYADDILDTAVGSETTKRVQIQYRLRVVTGVNLFSYPYGLDDPAVVAFSVPTNAGTPNGVSTAFTYVNQSSAGDPGLWVAGDGVPTNTLGTVDGYMYAIPLLAVFRRNTSAFDRRLNQNGGVASPGPSDRPDGLFSDIIAPVDLVDLRQGVSTTGWSLSELLEKNANYILDNSLRTEITDTSPDGAGVHGTTVLRVNEIGILPGDGVSTGSTGSGPLVAQFDAVRRRFSDRAIFETVTVAYPAPGGAWADGATISISPTAFPVYPYAAYNWASYAPAEIRFVDMVELHWSGAAPPKKTVNAEPYVQSLSGIGSSPITTATLKFGAIGALGLTDETLYVTMLVGYPTDSGLSHTPVEQYGNNSFQVTTGPIPAGAPISFSSFVNRVIDPPHREVQLEYATSNLTITMPSDPTSNIIHLPERANTIVTLTVNAVATPGVLDGSGRFITLGAPPAPAVVVSVTYTAIRPMPQLAGPDVQMAIFYRAAAPQMARSALLSTSLSVIPKLVGQQVYSLTAGSGSQEEGYPFPTSYVQTGGVLSTSPYSGESELSSHTQISVANFSANTGLLTLPVYVPMVANPESLTLIRGLGDIDVEARTFFSSVSPGYTPNAYAQDLSARDRHKNVLPILAELAADGPLGHRGQLVIILLIRYALLDETNGVFFIPSLSNTTTASVFRVKGLLLNKRTS